MNSDNPTTDSKISTSESQKTTLFNLTLFHFIRNLKKFCFLGIGNKSSG